MKVWLSKWPVMLAGLTVLLVSGLTGVAGAQAGIQVNPQVVEISTFYQGQRSHGNRHHPRGAPGGCRGDGCRWAMST